MGYLNIQLRALLLAVTAGMSVISLFTEPFIWRGNTLRLKEILPVQDQLFPFKLDIAADPTAEITRGVTSDASEEYPLLPEVMRVLA
jgi:hypothetical protein